MSGDILELLDKFTAAWNSHDVELLVACMTEDGVFRAAAGAGPDGDVYIGRAALRKAFEAIFLRFPDARWMEAVHTVASDVALSEWTFAATDTNGVATTVRGCDILRIRDGKIAVKDTFRKQVTVKSH
jgi:ketosteroid isomerase-like protein